jgi:hypothetical protein
MKAATLCASLLSVASVWFVAWRVYAVKTEATPHFDVLLDPSISHPDGCELLVGLAERALDTDGGSSRSTLTVLVVGDQTTDNEPWQLGTYAIPARRRALEGRSANLQRQQDLLLELRNKCQAIHPTTISPIFLGVKESIADLRARGCGEGSHCKLFVDSDLEENVESSIEKSLSRTTDGGHALPQPIENDGIDVAFCGIAVTTGRFGDSSSGRFRETPARTPARADRLRAIWRSLFTNPGTVNFEPYCSGPGVDSQRLRLSMADSRSIWHLFGSLG